MARRNHVWFVLEDLGDTTGPSLEPKAAFTLKHELIDYLRAKANGDGEALVYPCVYRLADGATGRAPERIDIEELLK